MPAPKSDSKPATLSVEVTCNVLVFGPISAKKGDVVALPREAAEALIKTGRVVLK